MEISILQYLWIRILMYGNGDRWQFYISRKFNFVTLFTDIWSKTNQILGDVMTNLKELLEIFEKKQHLGYPMKLDIWHSYVKYSDLPGKVNECWKTRCLLFNGNETEIIIMYDNGDVELIRALISKALTFRLCMSI